MEVSINEGIPKWLVYSGKTRTKMGDLGIPPFQETSMSGQIITTSLFSLTGIMVRIRGAIMNYPSISSISPTFSISELLQYTQIYIMVEKLINE